MYGWKKAAVLTYNQVSILLQAVDYHPIIGSMGMLKHFTRKKLVCSFLDDFGIKSYSLNDIHHLVDALKPQYISKIDWTGNNFLDVTLK